ncbi:MAG: glycosyltransferase family 4 protein [Candidatus Binatia bacterium]
MQLAIFQPRFQQVGGAERLAAMQAAYFQSQAIDVKVVTMGFDPTLWRDQLGTVPVVCVAKRRWTDLFTAWSRLAKLRRRAQRAAAHLRGCDVAIAHNYPCSTMLAVSDIPARKIWQCNEVPKNLHVREGNPAMAARVAAAGGGAAEEVSRAFARQLRAYDRALARKASLHARRAFDVKNVRRFDEVYAISQFSRDNARRIYGRCRAEIIPPMVRFPSPIHRRSGLDRSGLHILVHSRLERPKNIDTVLRGFARFRQTAGRHARLHVVGDGTYRRRLQCLARELCPADAIQFHGYLTELAVQRVYAACDVLAFLPVDEPFGMVFPEAAAHGLLLIGPSHGGPLEILDGGRLGWTCDAFAPDALADVLHEVWALDDATVERRRAETDRACRARYAPQTVGPKLLALLRQVSGTPGAIYGGSRM